MRAPRTRTRCCRERHVGLLFGLLLLCTSLFATGRRLLSETSARSAFAVSVRRVSFPTLSLGFKQHEDAYVAVNKDPKDPRSKVFGSGIDVPLFVDAFIAAGKVMLIGRSYPRFPEFSSVKHDDILVDVRPASVPSAQWVRLSSRAWYETLVYETQSVGEYALPMELLEERVDVRVTLGALSGVFPAHSGALDAPEALPPPTHVHHRVVENHMALPSPPRIATAPSSFAMCTVFRYEGATLRLFIAHWVMLGVDSFVLYYNGNSTDLDAIAATLRETPDAIPSRVRVIFYAWPTPSYYGSIADLNHGQSMAAASCFHRHRGLAQRIAFFDADEFLVFGDDARGPSTLQQLFDMPRFARLDALRFYPAWTVVGAVGGDGSGNITRLAHLTYADIVSSAPVSRLSVQYTREKYVARAEPSSSVKTCNVHGVYSLERTNLTDSVPPAIAYILHLLNADNAARERVRIEYFVSIRNESLFPDDALQRTARRAMAARRVGMHGVRHG